MSLKTWEIVKEVIEDNQPIKAVKIQEKLGLTDGQVAGALRTLRMKDMVLQSQDKSYSLKKVGVDVNFKKELTDLVNKYSVLAFENSDVSDLYKKVESFLKKLD